MLRLFNLLKSRSINFNIMFLKIFFIFLLINITLRSQEMTSFSILPRNEVPKEYQWNLESLYSSIEEWEESLNEAISNENVLKINTLLKYKNTLAKRADILANALKLYFNASRQIDKLYTYARLRHDEDIANDRIKSALGNVISLVQDFKEKTAWIDPEILSIPDKTLKDYLNSPILSEYKTYIKKNIYLKNHTLSSDKEEILTQACPALRSPSKIYKSICNADFSFGKIIDSEGHEKTLTNNNYEAFLNSQDRTLRFNAFSTIHAKFAEFENSLCEMLNGQIQAHLFNTKTRNYSSCLESSLYHNNISNEVYYSLIAAIRQNVDILHKYVLLRKKILNLDELHLYDMHVPLLPQIDKKYTYEEGENLVIEAMYPLGKEYQQILRSGLIDKRWVDRYENKNKRSGGYSSGCYDSEPYILLNFQGKLRDVFILAHEAGHSMHHLLTNLNQPYQYSHLSIFVAEVASTFNENLLHNYLMKKSNNKKEKIYLLKSSH